MNGEFTKVMPNAWDYIQMNAGIIVTGFDPTATPPYSAILGATGDGLTFNPNPEFEDFGEDIDNCPPNTMQLKRVKSYDPSLSGTFKTITQALAAKLSPGVLNSSTGVITPAMELNDSMFEDLAVLGDYSRVNRNGAGGQKAGFCAVKIKRALNTSGYQWKTTKDGKGEFPFDFHGHYDLNNIDDPPFEIYVVPGTSAMAALIVASEAGTTSGKSKITVSGYTLGTGESYKYKTASSAAPVVAYNDTIGEGWTSLTSGSEITPTSGHTKIAVVVVNSNNKAIGYGSATLVVNT